MDKQYDVVVIGAGFAGATAARECAVRGLRTVVLEGSDRIGGRTGTIQNSAGRYMELGGMYVCWTQAHVWSEIVRYGLLDEVVPGAEAPEWILRPEGDGLTWHRAEEGLADEQALYERMFADSKSVFPIPTNPFAAADEVARLDQVTIRDRLEELQVPEDEAQHMLGTTAIISGPDEKTQSLLSMMRFWAAGGHTFFGFGLSLMALRLARGTKSLLENILADGGAELRLNTAAKKIVSVDDGVQITCSDGAVISASAVVVATPPGVWPHLDFEPALPAHRLDFSDVQHPSAWKSMVTLRNEPRTFSIHPKAGHAIGEMWTFEKTGDDEQIAVIFGGSEIGDANDESRVRAAIKDVLPEAEVTEIITTTYTLEDEFLRGGWSLLKTGYLTRFEPHTKLATPEGRVVFASSDLGRLWPSCIDGAVESGLTAGRHVRELLATSSGSNSTPQPGSDTIS